MKTITVTTKKKNELYEYAKKLGFEFDEWKFSQKGRLRWTGRNTMFSTSSIIASIRQESVSCR